MVFRCALMSGHCRSGTRSWPCLQKKEPRRVNLTPNLQTQHLSDSSAGTPTSLPSASHPSLTLLTAGLPKGGILSIWVENAKRAPPVSTTHRYSRAEASNLHKCVCVCERESSSVLLCSWCGPHRVTWAVPSSCVREGETSGRCSSAHTPPGNCNTRVSTSELNIHTTGSHRLRQAGPRVTVKTLCVAAACSSQSKVIIHCSVFIILSLWSLRLKSNVNWPTCRISLT